MTYMVVRKGQLVEHEDNREALKEAKRLARIHGETFYVVEGKAIAQPVQSVMALFIEPKIGLKHAMLLSELLDCDEMQHGQVWTMEADELLASMWLTGDYTLAGIAKVFKRSEYAIECRLDKLNINY